MRETINGSTFLVEFDSIDDFCKYIMNTDFNEVFSDEWRRASITSSESFAYTKSFDEAMNLLKNGWDDMAKELNQKLEAKEKNTCISTRKRMTYDVAGYQACVPRYLQGIPTSMVNSKNVPVKQKVVTINKSVGYRCGLSVNKIVEESVKALQLIKKIEAQGTKVNLNVILGDTSNYHPAPGSTNNFGAGTKLAFKVRVKNSNERMNIAKMAFCMVNPSMYRRMAFRFMEVYPHTPQSFRGTYGYPVMDMNGLKEFCKGEYILPLEIEKNVETLKDLESFFAGK